MKKHRYINYLMYLKSEILLIIVIGGSINNINEGCI